MGYYSRVDPGTHTILTDSMAYKGGAGKHLTRSTLSKDHGDAPVRVIFEVSPDHNILPDDSVSFGGQILYARPHIMAMELPEYRINEIINSTSTVKSARLPLRFSPTSVTGEGVTLTGASNYHSQGYTGAGIKVAVIDIGFKGLSEAQQNGDIPLNAIAHDFSGRGLQTEYKHGTGCAEIIHEMAPSAELHILKIYDEIDYYHALDYCLINGIHIISASISTSGSGPGNGTGPVSEAAQESSDSGILYVNSAGNKAINGSRGRHWKGSFFDANRDNIHEFIPGDLDSYANAIRAYPDQDDDGNPETNEVSVTLRWNDWPSASVDYDIYLYDYFTGELIDYSNAVQNGSQSPKERMVVNLPDNENYYHYYTIVVSKPNGEPAGVEIELILGGTSYFVPFGKYTEPIATSSSSICEPADAEGVLAVGAVRYSNWPTGPQENFSSQGPTNAWAGTGARIKPDICGPDGTNGYVYGETGFYGTSAAAPHVAGAAALVKQVHPDWSSAQLKSYLESGATDMGTPGKDNQFGNGLLSLPLKGGKPDGTVPVFRFWNANVRHHFYTSNEQERDHLICCSPDWDYDGITWYVYLSQQPNTWPVYRFWSDTFLGHFYSASESEKNNIACCDSDWRYEGIAWYATIDQQSGSIPVYQFWNDSNKGYFYTSGEAEKNQLICCFPEWTYQGIAYRAFP